METLTYNQYLTFLKGELKIKVLKKKDLFYNSVCPVISIGIGWVTCDVDEDGGTHSFKIEDIEITNDEILYK